MVVWQWMNFTIFFSLSLFPCFLSLDTVTQGWHIVVHIFVKSERQIHPFLSYCILESNRAAIRKIAGIRHCKGEDITMTGPGKTCLLVLLLKVARLGVSKRLIKNVQAKCKGAEKVKKTQQAYR